MNTFSTIHLGRWISIIVIFSFFIMVLLSTFFHVWQITAFVEANSLESIRHRIADEKAHIELLFRIGEPDLVTEEMVRLNSDPGVEHVMLINEKGQILYDTNRANFGQAMSKILPVFDPLLLEVNQHERHLKIIFDIDHKHLLAYQPIAIKELVGKIRPDAIGGLLLNYNLSLTKELALKEIVIASLVELAFAIMIMLAMILIFHYWLTLPLTYLRKMVNYIGEGNFTKAVRTSGRGELAKLATAIIRMQHDLAVAIDKHKLTQAALQRSIIFANATIDAVSNHICVLDKTGKILAVNKAWRDFYIVNSSVSKQENYYIGENYIAICDRSASKHCNEAKLVSDGIRKVINGAMDVFFIEYPCNSNLEVRWFLVRISRFNDDSGNVVVSHENITERKKTEIERERLLKIIMEAPDFIACSDMEAHLTFLNPAGARLVGLPDNVDLTPLQIKDMHPQWATTRVLEEGVPAVLQQGYWQGETALRNRLDGHEIPVSQLLLVHRDGNGVPQQLSTIMRDITSFKQAEQALIQAKESAEMLARTKSEFLANMSHEIRTPMNAIIGLSHLALDKNLSIEVRDYLEKINASSESLLGILNDILDFSKIEAGKLSIDNTAFKLVKMLGNLHNLFSVKAEAQHLSFIIEAPSNIPNKLIGDALRIQQILANLLGNAIKFTQQGRINLKLRLLEQKKSQVRLDFSVSDTGIGISQEDQAKLFQPFSQADTSITRRFGGTGLGLAISRNLLQLMGSDLHVDSIPGQGTTFSFKLWLEVATADSNPTVNRSQHERKPHALSVKLREYAQTISGTRILVAEDNSINQQVVKGFLQLAGVTVDIANNGIEAIQFLEKNQYHAILMDVHMPLMDGIETTKQIRKQAQYAQLPIIALTAGVTTEERERCLACGMNNFVAKPINPEELINLLQQRIHPEPIEKN
ncbi:two-component system, sensor histidine kinase [Gammaproteobacteria bacterium]